MACLFVFFIMSFKEQKFSVLVEVCLINLFFMNHAFGVEADKFLSNPKSQKFFPMFYSGIFIALGFTFELVIPFELILDLV